VGDKIDKNEISGACSSDGGEKRCVQGFWGNLRERDHWVDPGVEGRILRWIFRKWNVWVWTALSWLRIVTGGGHL
jgi:hypothetical protein